MDCVLVAGGRPEPKDPLYVETQGEPKALLEIDGRPIVELVLQALHGAESIDRVVLVGLDADVNLDKGQPLETIADQGGLVANGLAGLSRLLERRPETKHVLFSSADIPAVSSDIVDDIVDGCRPFEKAAYYFMVDRQTMERSYPNSARTFVRLKDMQVAGADMFIADARLASENSQLLHDMAAGRKRPWKLARIVGLGTLLALWLSRLTLAGIEHRAETVIGRPVSVQLTPHAQLAMDVDKPEQLQLLRKAMASTGPERRLDHPLARGTQ
ncbi:MAG: nucleotidyltransferase family protein [Chloroflexota bacterium]|nr:MAG: nucleotidyltransferase family protein [Chloroflexota bacterium]